MGAESSKLFPSSPEQEIWCGVCSYKKDEESSSEKISGNRWDGIHAKDIPIKVPHHQNLANRYSPDWSIEDRKVVLNELTANPIAMHNSHARRALFENLKENGHLHNKTICECEEYGKHLAKQAAMYNAVAVAEYGRHHAAQKLGSHASRGGVEVAAM